MRRRPTARAITRKTNGVARSQSSDDSTESFVTTMKLRRNSSLKRVQLEIQLNNTFKFDELPPLVLHSQSISFRLNPIHSTRSSPSLIKDRNTTVQVYYNAKLQEKIDQCEPKLHVDLSYCDIIDRDMLLIVNRLIVEKKCTELWLYGNQITSEGIATLASSLKKNSTLKSLDLSFNQITDDGVQLLTQALIPSEQSLLKILYLSKNRISDIGAKYLADMLRTNHTITELWLSDNEIGNKGVEYLTDALAYQNRTLKLLSLARNIFITDFSIDDLTEIFQRNQVLRKIWINACTLTDQGKAELCEIANREKKIRIHC